MAFYTKDPVRKQTIWGQHGPDKEWHAFIDADVTDETVIENAKPHCRCMQSPALWSSWHPSLLIFEAGVRA